MVSPTQPVRSQLRIVAFALALAACGSGTDNIAADDGGGGVGDGGIGDGDGGWVNFADANPNAPDAGVSVGCTPQGTQCNNCIDDDQDGFIDGFDPECTGPLDDLENSFGTGIRGDNIDAKIQDCFFDGNSGSGDDKCKFHTCCLLTGPCPAELQPPRFDPADCVVSQACIDNCAPLTPPGCDCFGCCTICDTAGCETVLTNPVIAPDCTQADIHDPTKCPTCTPVAECGNDCTQLECQLCPGQTEQDLPATCTGTECAAGLTTCAGQSDCLDTEFCSQGCCIRSID